MSKNSVWGVNKRKNTKQKPRKCIRARPKLAIQRTEKEKHNTRRLRVTKTRYSASFLRDRLREMSRIITVITLFPPAE